MSTDSPADPGFGTPEELAAAKAPGVQADPTAASVNLSPLFPDDPPQLGPYWLDARLTTKEAGIAYVGHDAENTPAMLILLSAGAAGDAAARDRLAGLTNEMDFDTVLLRGGHGQNEGRLAKKFFDESHEPAETGSVPEAPWIALAYDGSPEALAEANRVLAEVQLADKPQLGTPAGPDYELPWANVERPGLSRIWPLPWPGRHDRAGWLSLLASWLLMLLIAAMAVLIAILIFQQASSESPPPPVPTQSQGSGSGSPSESQSGNPSDSQSGSPSDSQSGSPAPSGSESQSGSPAPSGSESQSGSPSPSGSQSQSGRPGSESGSGAPGGMSPTSKL